ncbi:MAG TPA: spore coat protein U domain-containing protein [Usitatibacter sp.]|nr:spore coat protein U domain-containing protein [Usitatibacter sp.]
MARWTRGALALAFLAGAAMPAAAAGTYALAANATILSKSSCKFNSQNGLVMSFGTINPSASVNATASVNLDIVCTGSAALAVYAISRDNGQHSGGTGGLRLRHLTNPTAFLPYSLNVPLSGTAPKGINRIVAINGTITPANFGNAIAGFYSDVVTLDITP